MTTNIKHKHADHVIIIEGHAFKADAAGRWDLTDIWRTLGLPKGKAPGSWRTRQAKQMEELHFLQLSHGSGAWAAKRAAIAYAAWVSLEFETLVYDAFEAILELPEVAPIVAEHMAKLGHSHSAEILKRMTFNDKCAWAPIGGHMNTLKGLAAAVSLGNISKDQARTLATRDGLRPGKNWLS